MFLHSDHRCQCPYEKLQCSKAGPAFTCIQLFSSKNLMADVQTASRAVNNVQPAGLELCIIDRPQDTYCKVVSSRPWLVAHPKDFKTAYEGNT